DKHRAVVLLLLPAMRIHLPPNRVLRIRVPNGASPDRASHHDHLPTEFERASRLLPLTKPSLVSRSDRQSLGYRDGRNTPLILNEFVKEDTGKTNRDVSGESLQELSAAHFSIRRFRVARKFRPIAFGSNEFWAVPLKSSM